MEAIAVISNKGGTGKTSLATHLAVEAERSGETVAPACASDTAEPTRRECPEINPSTPAARARFWMMRRAETVVNRCVWIGPPRRICRKTAPRVIPACPRPLSRPSLRIPAMSPV